MRTGEEEGDQALRLYESDPDSVVVCHICDQIHRSVKLEENQLAHCSRCHAAIGFPDHVKVEHTVALSITSLFLVIGSLHYEFLGVFESGFSSKASIGDVIVSFSQGWYVLLGIFVGAFVIGLPILRALTLIYVMWPMMFDQKPYANARRVFAFSQNLGPWMMTEIFIIGTGVALVKIVALASVELGASFWIFSLLVLCLSLMNLTVHRRAVWEMLREDAA